MTTIQDYPNRVNLRVIHVAGHDTTSEKAESLNNTQFSTYIRPSEKLGSRSFLSSMQLS